MIPAVLPDPQPQRRDVDISHPPRLGFSRALQPHIVAVAGLVPCAACGTMISLRARSPRAPVIGANHGQRRRTHRAHRPWDSTTRPGMPVTSFNISCSSNHARKESLPVRLPAQRDMTAEKLGQHRVLIAGLRVVLHRARARG